jgi:hypothetical protein
VQEVWALLPYKDRVNRWNLYCTSGSGLQVPATDGLCGIYKKRFKMNPSGCFTRNEMITKDFLLPEGCPYTRLRKGYKPARVVSEKEFMSIMITEELLGNKNILLVELGLLKPNLIKII